jgi:hypothetical protein
MNIMKRKSHIHSRQSFLVWLLWVGLALGPALTQTTLADHKKQDQTPDHALTRTAFIYQGQLKDSGVPASGSYDLRFTLYSAQTGGDELGSIIREALILTNGMFRVELDFGRATLDSQESWLEVAVRPGSSTDAYVVLSPRQRLTPTPYAIFAQQGQWSLIGVPVGFASDADKGVSVADEPVTSTEMSSSTPPPGECRLDLPCASSASSSEVAFSITNTGGGGLSGGAGAFINDNGGSAIPALLGQHSGDGPGVLGQSETGEGVFGISSSGIGVRAQGSRGVTGIGMGSNSIGVDGFSPSGVGVRAGSSNGVCLETRSTTADFIRALGVLDQLRFIVKNNGRVGIGTANPLAMLHASAPSNSQVPYAVLARYEGSSGTAGSFENLNSNASQPALVAATNSTFPAAQLVGLGDVEPSGGGILLIGGVNGPNIAMDTNEIMARNDGSTSTLFLQADGGPVAIGTSSAPPADIALAVNGTARTQVLEITGGSDLAEPFEMSGTEAIKPGMVVAIDPEQPGRLRISDKAYDRTVAGIVSGANGINPGLTMKQEGSVADGSLPVSLTGRVYCWTDASYGPIEPGDLLTTSETPGHAMRVTHHKKAQGAIIGKAMTGLKHGQGLVLVLVSLQ